MTPSYGGGYYDKGYDKSYDKGYDKSYDRSYDKGYDKGYDKSYDKGYDKSYDKGYDKGYDKPEKGGSTTDHTYHSDSKYYQGSKPFNQQKSYTAEDYKADMKKDSSGYDARSELKPRSYDRSIPRNYDDGYRAPPRRERSRTPPRRQRSRTPVVRLRTPERRELRRSITPKRFKVEKSKKDEYVDKKRSKSPGDIPKDRLAEILRRRQ